MVHPENIPSKYELETHALNIASTVRQELGGDRLKGLPQGFMNEPGKCLIANALNFDCEVSPNREFGEVGYARFRKEEHAKAFSIASGNPVTPNNRIRVESFPWKVELTPKLNILANLFDSGYLPEYQMNSSSIG